MGRAINSFAVWWRRGGTRPNEAELVRGRAVVLLRHDRIGVALLRRDPVGVVALRHGRVGVVLLRPSSYAAELVRG